jgi:CarboxypepD_reg-like domain/Gram-negative bacterial TonB protein C-terminal
MVPMAVYKIDMAEQKKHSIYSEAAILDYLTGKMTAPQMYDLEKAALDDPLLADAIEGYGAMQGQQYHKQLDGLKARFASLNSSPPIVLHQRQAYTRWWKAAAAVVLIGSSIALAYVFTKDKQPESSQVATISTTTDPGKEGSNQLLADSIQSSPTINDLAKNKAILPGGTKPYKTFDNNEAEEQVAEKPLIANKEVARADSSFVYRPGGEAAKPLNEPSVGGYQEEAATARRYSPPSTNNAAAPVQQNVQNAAAQTDYSSKEEVIDKSSREAKKSDGNQQYARQLRAQVVGTDNKPVAFANVNILNNRKSTYADANGDFGIALPDSIVQVEVKSVGYATRQYTFKTGATQNKIILEPQNNPLNEAVVTKGFGKARAKVKDTKAETDSMNIAEPVDGWGNYNTYLTNNLKLPDETIKKDIHGEVQVSFEVKSNGAISNIKVDKPLCGNCDEEAVRLVKQGPQWKVKKGKKASARVKVQF